MGTLRYGYIFGMFAALAVFGAQTLAQSTTAPADNNRGLEIFTKSVRPILQTSCLQCHGNGPKNQGDLDVSTRDFLVKPRGDNEAVVEPGNAEDSELYQRITEKNPSDRMPKDQPALSADQIEQIRQWIVAGAPFDKPLDKKVVTPWPLFQPVVRPAVPVVKNVQWVRNPIDAFVAAEYEKKGLTPRPEASKEQLLRRVYIDLIGLPPTPDELHAFLADNSPDAYEEQVDKLLADPRYGERWGRHWMDVWRYSDSYGFGMNGQVGVANIWHWRDWIIESLNADKGYDRMVQEMLAGDELAPNDPSVHRATGFLARNFYNRDRDAGLDAVIEHTGKAFLGVTMNCARCHDHKYDPITQKDYYSMRAIFEPYSVRQDIVPNTTAPIERAFDAHLATPTYLYIKGDSNYPDKAHPLAPAVPAGLGGDPFAVQEIALPPEACKTPLRTQAAMQLERDQKQQAIVVARKALLDDLDTPTTQPGGKAPAVVGTAEDRHKVAEAKLAVGEAQLTAFEAVLKVEDLEDQGKKDSSDWKDAAIVTTEAQRQQALAEAQLNDVMAQQAFARATAVAEKYGPATTAPASDKAKATRDSAVKNLADAKGALAQADKALAAAQAQVNAPAGTDYKPRILTDRILPQTSTGRRLALARWITGPQNPLASRVAVNHIWARHFGAGLQTNPFDFGRRLGQLPSNPQLLDWLAAEFMDKKWSMKAIHRLIVTSSTYRMASTPDATDLAADPDNHYLWRMNPRRVEAEVIRDCLLYLSGNLDKTIGGEIAGVDNDEGKLENSHRRSLYFNCTPAGHQILTVFDGANVLECYERNVSVMPQQALALTNSQLVIEQSRVLAKNLSTQVGGTPGSGSDEAFVDDAFETILSRLPSKFEKDACVQFLSQQAASFADSKNGKVQNQSTAGPWQRAREDLVVVLFNHTDFVTIH